VSVELAPRLIDVPISGLYPIDVEDANAFLLHVGHNLGPCKRPFRMEAFGKELDGRLIAVAISASLVGSQVVSPDGLEVLHRGEVVELARLAATDRHWTRVMLREWREACAPRWTCWPVTAAVSYSQNALHKGHIYRADGWARWRTDAGSSGGGTYSRKRYASDAVHGSKTVWVWRFGGGLVADGPLGDPRGPRPGRPR
jgi:hypothetical protein